MVFKLHYTPQQWCCTSECESQINPNKKSLICALLVKNPAAIIIDVLAKKKFVGRNNSILEDRI